MSLTEDSSNPLQVAMVRLRLEGIKFRELHRSEFMNARWPFADDRILVLVRATADPIQGSPGVVLATLGPMYVMSDGLERPLTNAMEFSAFYDIAMALSGMWMSSGWVG